MHNRSRQADTQELRQLIIAHLLACNQVRAAPDDVWVLELAQDRDLAQRCARDAIVLGLEPNALERHDLVRLEVERLVDDAVRAFSNRPALFNALVALHACVSVVLRVCVLVRVVSATDRLEVLRVWINAAVAGASAVGAADKMQMQHGCQLDLVFVCCSSVSSLSLCWPWSLQTRFGGNTYCD